MLSPSPNRFNRLERILELVTEHERVYREQVCIHAGPEGKSSSRWSWHTW
jgi:hypothetical protein